MKRIEEGKKKWEKRLKKQKNEEERRKFEEQEEKEKERKEKAQNALNKFKKEKESNITEECEKIKEKFILYSNKFYWKEIKQYDISEIENLIKSFKTTENINNVLEEKIEKFTNDYIKKKLNNNKTFKYSISWP